MQLNATDPASDVYCPTWGGGEGESVVQQAPNGRFPTFGGGGADTSNNASEFNMGCVLFCVSPSLFLALSRSVLFDVCRWINLPITAGPTATSITVDLTPLKVRFEPPLGTCFPRCWWLMLGRIASHVWI
jgi:hypothetical protein